MKHIGILAHSFEGATLCFRTACLEGVKRLGSHMHPEVTMTCSPMSLLLEAWERSDNQTLRAAFINDANKLAAAGCDFFVCPDNTAHIALETGGEPYPIPGLHIGEVVAEQAKRDGRTKVGILGTRFTMTGPVYPGALGRRLIYWAVPDEADRLVIDGCNFLGCAPGYSLGDESSRDQLLFRLQEYGRAHPAHRLTLFFDGQRASRRQVAGIDEHEHVGHIGAVFLDR